MRRHPPPVTPRPQRRIGLRKPYFAGPVGKKTDPPPSEFVPRHRFHPAPQRTSRHEIPLGRVVVFRPEFLLRDQLFQPAGAEPVGARLPGKPRPARAVALDHGVRPPPATVTRHAGQRFIIPRFLHRRQPGRHPVLGKKVHILPVIQAGAKRVRGLVRIMEIPAAHRLKGAPRIVPDQKVPFLGGPEVPVHGQPRHQTLPPLLIPDSHRSFHPAHAILGMSDHGAAEPFRVGKILKIEAQPRIKSTAPGPGGRRPGATEVA